MIQIGKSAMVYPAAIDLARHVGGTIYLKLRNSADECSVPATDDEWDGFREAMKAWQAQRAAMRQRAAKNRAEIDQC